MSQVADRSCEARQKLGQALGLLQELANHEVFVAVAIPVARAMGALHTIEYSRGMDLATQGPVALRFVREALEASQANPLTGVIGEATSAIAGSLSLVHGLAQEAETTGLVAERLAADPGASSRALSTTRPSVTPPSNLRQPKINVSIAPSPAAPGGGMDRTLLVKQAAPGPPHARANASRPQAGDLHSSARISQPQPGPTGTQASAQYRPAHGAAPHPEGLHARRHFDPHYSSKNPPPPPGGIPPGATPLVVSLGAYSPSNFYKGLSGHDVVDDGGLFVATYDIPALESSLWLTVHMPGGYEFEAHAIVKWSRKTGMGDAPPGYGCVFLSVSAEARQLVHRYTRNREPLFHDDL